MLSLTFWPHLDEEWMWRWDCFDNNRNRIARSSKSYFSHSEVLAAIDATKLLMARAAAA